MIKLFYEFCCRIVPKRNYGGGAKYQGLSYIEQLASLDVSASIRPQRQAGIICTIGPPCNDVETLAEMMENGMGIARLNMAHGTREQHVETIKNIRKANYIYAKKSKLSRLIGIAIDIEGPAIRTGMIKPGKRVFLKKGQEVTITINKKYADDVTESMIYVSYLGKKKLTELLNVGSTFYLHDGLIELTVLSIEGENIRCKVENGGNLGSKQGVNLPGVDIDLPTLFEKDRDDIQLALEQKADIIFLSFARNKDGVEEIRGLIDEGDKDLQMSIIAKIENQQGLENLDEILDVADGVMVARGDLGIELPLEKGFLAQKKIIAKCNLAGKPVICATHMLDSMIHKPRPTRAETSDIANAVLDGSDCVMLSGETAAGKYPVECVKVMEKACREAEVAFSHSQKFTDLTNLLTPPTPTIVSASFAAVTAAEKVLAVAILTISETGLTAGLLSAMHPICPIIAITQHAIVARKYHLFRGVIPVLHVEQELGNWVKEAERKIKTGLLNGHQMGVINEGDMVVVLLGWRAGRGRTNTLQIVKVSKDWIV